MADFQRKSENKPLSVVCDWRRIERVNGERWSYREEKRKGDSICAVAVVLEISTFELDKTANKSGCTQMGWHDVNGINERMQISVASS